MSYTDILAVLDALDIPSIREMRDTDHLDIALEEIQRLQSYEKAVKHALGVYSLTGDIPALLRRLSAEATSPQQMPHIERLQDALREAKPFVQHSFECGARTRTLDKIREALEWMKP